MDAMRCVRKHRCTRRCIKTIWNKLRPKQTIVRGASTQHQKAYDSEARQTQRVITSESNQDRDVEPPDAPWEVQKAPTATRRHKTGSGNHLDLVVRSESTQHQKVH